MHLSRALVVTAALTLTTADALAGGAQSYDFTINTAASGLSATASFSIGTSGTLIGNWDPKTNPMGTRTKPGINPFAPFGPTENLPVMLDLGAGIGGAIDTAPTGGFRMTIAPVFGGIGVLGISGFSANLLSGGPINLPLTVGFEFEGFRTRNPSSIFLGGIPLEIPLGGATVSALSVQQTDGAAPGFMTETSPGMYDFIISPIVTLNATFDLFGTQLTIPGAAVPMPIVGTLSMDGDTATLLSVHPIDLAGMLAPGLALPEFAFDLPTLLPPGDTAGLLLNLTLGEIAAGMSGTHTLSASGVVVPAPGLSALVAICLGTAGLRRRRR